MKSIETVSVIIERIIGGAFIVSKASFYSINTGESHITVESNRYNIFGQRLDDIVRTQKIYQTRVIGGVALSSNFKTIEDAMQWALKQNFNIVAIDEPHKIITD